MAGRSLRARAVAGAAWTILTGTGSRVLGLVGTIVLTYYLSREALGEVSDAAIVVFLASQLTTFGTSAYVVSKQDAGRDVLWHSTVLHNGLGIVALALCFLLVQPLAHWTHAPALGQLLPGLALSTFFDRVLLVPERILYRDMKFRLIGIERTVGELSYTAVSVGLAMTGMGAMCVVWANVARSFLRLVIVLGVVPRAEWLTPSRLSWATFRELFRFGIPFWVSASASQGARKFDNLLMSNYFGTAVVGAYNQAYNVADVPAIQVGEQIGDVLLPSFARMDAQGQGAALTRATGLLTLVVAPLAVGLGAVAPTLVHAMLRAEWAEVAPMLTILSVLSVTRPIGWTISAYLTARDRPRLITSLEVLKLAALVLLMVALHPLGPLATAGAVGLAFTLHTVASVAVVHRVDGMPFLALFRRAVPPIVACVPMVLAILAVRAGMNHAGISQKVVRLAIELVAGAVAYVPSALVIARGTSRDFLDLLMGMVRRKRGGEAEVKEVRAS